MYSVLLSALTFASLALASPSPGCKASSSPKGGIHIHSNITVGPHVREFTVYLPPGYSTCGSGLPLILSYHGNGKSSEQQEQLDQFTTPSNNDNHIVVYPQGYDPAPYAVKSASDLDFMAQLLPVLEQTYCIDTSRIYAAGKSVGGGFVSALACDPHLGPQFAAFAPVSGAFYWDTPQNHTNCAPGKRPSGKTPILEFHGLNDTTIPYTGGEHNGVDLPDVYTWAVWWKVRNGCDLHQKPVNTTSFDDNVTRIVYQGCEVEHWAINNLGHAWPSTQPNSDNPNGTYINATPIIMNWFKSHSL